MPPSFSAVAMRDDRVRVVFSEPMLSNGNLLNPAQYVVSIVGGATVPVSAVIAEQSSGVRSTVLSLGTALQSSRLYRLRILAGVVSEGTSEALQPDADVFQWVETALTTEVPLATFSGAATGGLFGDQRSFVFFSPALESPAANSSIEVEQVDTCSLAYDQYRVPEQPELANVLATHGSWVGATPVVSTLNTARFVLPGGTGIGPVVMQLVDRYFDTMPTPADGPATATLVESWPVERVALLNNPTWKLYEPGNPETFITAANLTPFPVGVPQVIQLQS